MAPSIISAAIFEKLVAGIKDYAIFVLDPDGMVLSWNAGAQLIKGYRPEEIVGKHFSVFYLPDAIAQKWPERELRAAAVEGRFEDEGWRIRKDGSRFWANVIITALREDDGRLTGFSKITRDLTTRRNQEEKIRQSEERFRLLIEGVQDYAIFMLDNDGTISSWNSGAERIKGYTASDVLGRHFSWFYVPEDVKAGKPWRGLQTARATGRSEDEGWRVRKSGERFWARVVITALYDAQGTPRGFAKVTQDLTERRQSKEFEDAARRLNEFVAMLAHELRNPLAPILNAVESLERMLPDNAMQAKLHGVISRQSRHLARIVDDLIDINRITRGVLSINRSDVDVVGLINHCVEAIRPATDAARQELQISLPGSRLTTLGDMHRLSQALTNILSNACRYTAAGGKINISALERADEIVISVTDTGRGIAPEDLERIFNLFDQGHRLTPENAGGLGIGLTLARRIVELHGGTVTVDSGGPGKGSVFNLRLPRMPVTIGSSLPGVDTQRTAPLPSRRVLVVDDHVDAARMFELLLQAEGHETCIAHDGPTALKAVEEFKPEFVFLDIGIPGMNGYEIARRLRGGENREGLFLVAVTGWGQPSDFEQSREAGFDLHLVKPVDSASVKRLLENPPPSKATLH
jgi:PAS domain S-box-containing protein